MKYKYLLSLDGWTAAWGRLQWIMFSGSVLLKPESSKVEWFYHEMEKNVHYISINHNLSDLAEKVNYLK